MRSTSAPIYHLDLIIPLEVNAAKVTLSSPAKAMFKGITRHRIERQLERVVRALEGRIDR
jgi:hypothetical protein